MLNKIINERSEYLKKILVPWKDNILNKLNLKKRIFRITEFKYVVNALSTNKAVFSNPRSWSDPYDSLFIKSIIRLKNGSLANQTYKDDYFVQCWAYQNFESDAMWRIYSQPESGEKHNNVMILSTPEKLMDSLWDDNDKNIHLNLFLGKVKYVAKSKLLDEDFFSGLIGNTSLGLTRALFLTLLFKTNAYNHENEIRFIMNQKTNSYQKRISVNHGINFSKLIDKIIVDPRASDEFYKVVKSKILELGFGHIKIIKSKMLKSEKIIYNLSL